MLIAFIPGGALSCKSCDPVQAISQAAAR
uniref:Uncharacterized protein n=1 Tax=Arundo donax TaxID=35708 RepID=A0A0A9FY93_ARUDO